MRWMKMFLAMGNEGIYIPVSGRFSQMQLRVMRKNGWRELNSRMEGWETDCKGEWVKKE